MKPLLAFSIDFEGFVESMEQSFAIPARFPRFDVQSELERNGERCLELLAAAGVTATFFVLGWIAERFPRLVARIAAAGHEVGSHAWFHRRLDALPREQVAAELKRSKQALEDAAGAAVIGFRAPDFSLSYERLPVLSELGFSYDSSVNPTNLHDVYGARADRPRGIHVIPGGPVEFPIPVWDVLGRWRVPVGGGGYFRLFPYALTRRLLLRHADPLVYLHPYEISGVHPHPPMSRARRFRHTFMNGRLDTRLADLFKTFQAVPLATYLRRRGHLEAA